MIEIVDSTGYWTAVTVTPTRVTIKIGTGVTNREGVANALVAAIGDWVPTRSYRGSYREGQDFLTLRDNSKRLGITFKVTCDE